MNLYTFAFICIYMISCIQYPNQKETCRRPFCIHFVHLKFMLTIKTCICDSYIKYILKFLLRFHTHSHIHAHTHAILQTYIIHVHKHTSDAYIHAFIHSYIYTCKHTYTFSRKKCEISRFSISHFCSYLFSM